MQQRVDYDRIAHLYDEPLRDHAVDASLLCFLDERQDLTASRLAILDVGCGTGKQLTADYNHLPTAWLIAGIDLSHAMLLQGQKRCLSVAWVQGEGARLPFRAGSFDYVTSQFSYHHVRDRRGMVARIFQILKPGGRFVMTNLDPWSMPAWFVYTFFPAAWARDRHDFFPVDEFTAILAGAGFSNLQVQRQHQREQVTLVSTLAYAIDRFRTSQLIAIDDDAYRLGIAAIRKDIETWGAQASVNSELCLVTVSGDKW